MNSLMLCSYNITNGYKSYLITIIEWFRSGSMVLTMMALTQGRAWLNHKEWIDEDK